MKHKIASLLLVVVSIAPVAAQKKWPIKPTYDAASTFTNGVAHVTLRDSLLFIDKTGKVLRGYLKNDVGPFSDGLAAIRMPDTKYGYLDLTGQLAIKPRFAYAHDFVEGVATVVEKNLMGLIDKTGTYVIPLKYFSLLDLSEGLIAAQSATTKKWGYIDKTGKTVIPHQFNQGNPFEGGYATVYDGSSTPKTIDKTGKFVIPPPASGKPSPQLKTDPRFPGAQEVGEASEGLMPAKRNGKWGYVSVE
ncbi:WG containing repeat-containing protein [Chryseolinea serpens]|uniref:WG containing repeat-containing protein n=1 Tax=Chryseolinea serpens TaxID=947013 RepID=A0A1M5REC5_9BACT|nr:WG repeat-containing protein [Chryseolinea serpens]SHH24379.1 WG containing repeat-containing protein [Chryseolinea serpens]